MLRRLIYILVIIIVLAGGYLLLSNQTATKIKITGGNPSPEPTIAKSGVSIILSERNDSGETGLASIVEKNSKVEVDINLVGPPFISQRAVIQAGSCDKLGTIKFILKNVFNGDSTTTLNLNIAEFNKGLPLALIVNKTEENSSQIVACGNIKK